MPETIDSFTRLQDIMDKVNAASFYWACDSNNPEAKRLLDKSLEEQEIIRKEVIKEIG